MRLTLLTTLLLTLLCTCGRAQESRTFLIPTPPTTTNIAFIKGETGFIIDSIAVSTSLDTVPYGFPFPNDTLVLDINIFDPVDEVTIETFGGGHSFKQQRFWVDAPTANVYLSIKAGNGVVDSVSLSPVDTWYRQKIKEIREISQLELLKIAVGRAAYESRWNLMSTRFLMAYLDLPNLNRQDMEGLQFSLGFEVPLAILRHPSASEIMTRGLALIGNEPGKLRKYPLITPSGKGIKLERPETDFYVLNLYRSDDPDSKKDHEIIQQAITKDSIFSSFPIISVNVGSSPALWRLYVRDGKFAWPHFWADPDDKKSLTDKLIYPYRPTYLLVNKQNKLEGCYHELDKLLAAVRWRNLLLNKP